MTGDREYDKMVQLTDSEVRAVMLRRRVRVSSKGRIVIPLEMRVRLGLEVGGEAVVHLLSDRLMVLEVPEPSELEKALNRIQAEVRERGITREDVERAFRETREEMRRERKDGQRVE